MFGLIIILVAIVVIAVFIYSIYRKLSFKRKIADNAWIEIKNQLDIHADLVPGIIKIFEDYEGYAPLLVEPLLDARNLIFDANTVTEYNQANNQLKDAIDHLYGEIDENPDLEKNSDLANIKMQLKDCENKINNGRHKYNRAVLDFNDLCQTFPYSYFTSVLGFKDKDYFKGYPEFDRHIPPF